MTTNRINLVQIFIIVCLFVIPAALQSETLISPNFQISSGSFVTAGGQLKSTNYQFSRTALGASFNGAHVQSTNYQILGFIVATPSPSVLQIIYRKPHSGETDVSVFTTIEATFNRQMDTKATESAFSINPKVEGSFSWQGNRIIFTPSKSLSFSTTYKVEIDSLAKDLQGNTFTGTIWSFTTESTQPIISISDANVQPGSTFELPIKIEHPQGLDIIAIDIVFTYESTIFTAVKVIKGPVMTEDWLGPSYTKTPGQITIGAIGVEPLQGSGILFKIIFEVDADAPVGATGTFHLASVKLNEGGVPCIIKDGTFTILELRGDVSGDGRVTAFDASLILQFVVGLVDSGDYPNLTVDIADVTGDKTISALDAAVILQYTVGLITKFPAEVVALAPSISAEKEAFLVAKATGELEGMNLSSEQKEVILQLKRLLSQKAIPAHTALFQNYPNPFNPETWIPYQLAEEGDVKIAIYTSKGQLIRVLHLGKRNAGVYITKDKAIYWDGRDSLGEKVASGLYFYALQAGEFRAARKMVIVK